MESSNPTLNNKVLSSAQALPGEATMTLQGTINKTMVLLGIVLIGALWVWGLASQPESAVLLRRLFWISFFGGLGVLIFGTVKPSVTPITGPLYAAFQGIIVGYISSVYYPAFAVPAIGVSLAVMGVMLLGYKTGYFQATPALRKGLIIAGMGYGLFILLMLGAGFFGIHPPGFVFGGGPLGIAFSLFAAGLAAMFLILDFDMVERFTEQRMPKYMEWYAATSLTVTLVWLYIEILRLLSKVNSRN